jgi:hypothetical protein
MRSHNPSAAKSLAATVGPGGSVIHATGADESETSSCAPLASVLNAVGEDLDPKVRWPCCGRSWTPASGGWRQATQAASRPRRDTSCY